MDPIGSLGVEYVGFEGGLSNENIEGVDDANSGEGENPVNSDFIDPEEMKGEIIDGEG